MITEFAAAMTLAASVWGQPACGTPTLGVAVYPTPAQLSVSVDRVTGFAEFDKCRVNLTPLTADPRRTDPTFACHVIVHEWGHLAGHEHSDDPKNVMYPETRLYYWRCIYGTDKDPLLTFRRGWKVRYWGTRRVHTGR